MLRSKKVLVIGAGATGQALCAFLISNNMEVKLYALPYHAHNFEVLKKAGNIRLTGVINNTVSLPVMTTDIALAMADVDVIFITLPSFAHQEVFEIIIPYLRNEQKILLLPGNFGSLELLKLIREKSHQLMLKLLKPVQFHTRVEFWNQASFLF